MKILKWVVIAIIVIPIVLVVSIFVRNKSVGPEGWAMDNTVKRLREQMKDPDSMVIRTSYMTKTKSADNKSIVIAICGVVDGRNTFGGYSGGTRFMSRSVSNLEFDTFDTYYVGMEDPEEKRQAESVGMLSGFESVYWNAHCVDAAHPKLEPTAKS